jgi:pyruvate dehydrogenase E1 component beta subunit
MPQLNLVKALNLALQQEMERDERVVVFGEDVAKVGGVFRVTEGLLDRFGPKRVLDTPVSEAGIIGCAVGMALYGLRPVCEIQFSGFAYFGFHQLNCHAARFRIRSWGQYSIPMVMRAPSGGGIRALEHHNDSEEALYAQSPGLKVVMPSGPRTARGLLASAIRDPDPVVFLEPKRLYRAVREEVPDEEEVISIGQARVARAGKHITILSYGAMVPESLAAADEAEKELQISAEVVDLLSLAPMDTATIAASVRKTGRCVVVHEAPSNCGIGAEAIARINEEALLSLEAPIARVTGYDLPYPFFAREQAYLPSVERIVAAIRRTMEF